MPVKPKQILSTGKVLWIEKDGNKSSPLRYVVENDRIYILLNGRNERLPELSDGDRVLVVGHPLAKQTRTGEAYALVHILSNDEVPRGVFLELAGSLYDPSLSPAANYEKLKDMLAVAALDIL